MAFPLAGSARLAVVPARPRPAAMRVAMTNARILLSLPCEGGADRASPRWSGVWRPRAAVRESAGGPHVHPSIGLSPGSPRTATPSAIGCKPMPRNQNGEWLTHSLLVHWIDTH